MVKGNRKTNKITTTSVPKIPETVTIHCPSDIYAKIMYLIDSCDDEVSGFGRCIFEDGVYKVLSVHLPKQECSAATTEIDEDSLGALEYEAMNEKGHLNWWWHSHVDMQVFWSSQDLDTIHEMGAKGLCLATVFNRKREQRSAVCFGADKEGFYPNLFVDKINFKITNTLSEEDKVELDKLLKENVTKEVYQFPTTYKGGYLSDDDYYGGGFNDVDNLSITEKDFTEDEVIDYVLSNYGDFKSAYHYLLNQDDKDAFMEFVIFFCTTPKLHTASPEYRFTTAYRAMKSIWDSLPAQTKKDALNDSLD